MTQRWLVLSPDRLPTGYKSFPSRGAAERHLYLWCARFAEQGYYAAASGERIPLRELPDRCHIESCWMQQQRRKERG